MAGNDLDRFHCFVAVAVVVVAARRSWPRQAWCDKVAATGDVVAVVQADW